MTKCQTKLAEVAKEILSLVRKRILFFTY